MAKKLTKSARIRKLLDQGKSVKQIAAQVQCTPQMVYQIRAADKKQARADKAWAQKAYSTSDKATMSVRREEVINEAIQSLKPYTMYELPRDYFQPKPTLWERFKSFIGA